MFVNTLLRHTFERVRPYTLVRDQAGPDRRGSRPAPRRASQICVPVFPVLFCGKFSLSENIKTFILKRKSHA